jgi:hypothetical protein
MKTHEIIPEFSYPIREGQVADARYQASLYPSRARIIGSRDILPTLGNYTYINLVVITSYLIFPTLKTSLLIVLGEYLYLGGDHPTSARTKEDHCTNLNSLKNSLRLARSCHEYNIPRNTMFSKALFAVLAALAINAQTISTPVSPPRNNDDDRTYR